MHLSLIVNSALLFILIILAAFFSSAETSMMSINRYKLKHLAKTSSKAKQVQRLLARPDRLIGMILFGNTFVSIFLGSIAAELFDKNLGLLLSSVITTIVLLIFGEVSPKTFAALYPEKIAFLFAPLLKLMLTVFYPIVWLINQLSNGLLHLLGISFNSQQHTSFSPEELRTIVHESSNHLPSKNRNMLLSILDLEKACIDDIMVRKNDIIGIDISQNWESIVAKLSNMQHNFLPVFDQDWDQVLGVIGAKKAVQIMHSPNFTPQVLRQALEPVIFVPQTTSLMQQMIYFQQRKQRFALVVDEYGDMVGLITLEDILEEIVGDFTTHMLDTFSTIVAQPDGSWILDGSTRVRDFNRISPYKLHSQAAKTINGTVLTYLENIPEVGTCCLLENKFPVEIIHMQDNKIKTLKIFPPLHNR